MVLGSHQTSPRASLQGAATWWTEWHYQRALSLLQQSLGDVVFYTVRNTDHRKQRQGEVNFSRKSSSMTIGHWWFTTRTRKRNENWDHFPSPRFTRCRYSTFHHHHPLVNNIKRSTVNVYRINRCVYRSIRVRRTPHCGICGSVRIRNMC